MATATHAQLLPEVFDEGQAGRRREATMAALILHLGFLILILVNPKFLHSLLPEPSTPAEEEQRTRSALTLLYIPPAVLKPPVPKKEELTPEERKRAVVRTPFTIDPRELRRVLPALPVPVDPGLQPQPTPSEGAGKDVQEERTLSQEEAREQRRAEIARLENIPEPGSDAPKLELPLGTAGRTIEESLRAGARGRGSQPADLPPGLPNLNTPYPLILSDTRGVEFGPYLARLLYEVRKNWYAVMPEAARLGRKGRVVIVFSIRKDGTVPLDQPAIVLSSEFLPFDRAALGAIRGSQPFQPLPAEFTGAHLMLQFTFLYNLPLDYAEP